MIAQKCAPPIASKTISTPAGRETAHSLDKVPGAIIDRRCAEAFDRRHVAGRAGPDRFQPEMPR